MRRVILSLHARCGAADGAMLSGLAENRFRLIGSFALKECWNLRKSAILIKRKIFFDSPQTVLAMPRYLHYKHQEKAGIFGIVKLTYTTYVFR